MRSEAALRADFSAIRYGQVWEDADVLLEALDIRPGDVCLSIASAGDNALALLTRDPAQVVAVDLSQAQLACLELRVAAFRELSHPQLLELMGSRPSARRAALYARCRPALSAAARTLWDSRSDVIERGIGHAGKLEHYFALFRTCVLPLVHSRETVRRLLRSPRGDLQRAYARHWDTWRWRLMFRLFFSRAVMGALGRDPEFFRYVEGDVATRILERTRHGLTGVSPSDNPYVHWILTGTHGAALPCALREEHFETIRERLDRLTWQQASLESVVGRGGELRFDRLNLSNLFEYVSAEHHERTLAAIVRACRPGARLVYWNLLVPRRRPESLAGVLTPLDALASRLHAADRAFFYSALRIEEVR